MLIYERLLGAVGAAVRRWGIAMHPHGMIRVFGPRPGRLSRHLVALLPALVVAVGATALPTVASAAQVPPHVVPSVTKVTVLPQHPCRWDASQVCSTTIVEKVSAHLVFPALVHGTAGACGSYNLRHSITRNDTWGGGYATTNLDATDGYDGCGSSWTININNASCTITGVGGSCDSGGHGGNYSDPNHSYWNNDWYNQYEGSWLGGQEINTWEVFLRLWNDGYGNTDSWSGST